MKWAFLPFYSPTKIVRENVHDRSKVCDHPDKLVFSMKTHTFIYQTIRK